MTTQPQPASVTTAQPEPIAVEGRVCKFVLNQGENLDGTKFDIGWYISDDDKGYLIRGDNGAEWRKFHCGDEGHWTTREAAEQFARQYSQTAVGESGERLGEWRTIDSAPRDGTRVLLC